MRWRRIAVLRRLGSFVGRLFDGAICIISITALRVGLHDVRMLLLHKMTSAVPSRWPRNQVRLPAAHLPASYTRVRPLLFHSDSE